MGPESPLSKLDVAAARPCFTPADAARLARELFGRATGGLPRELASERDQNFLVGAPEDDDGALVLKISCASESRATLEHQHAALRVIEARAPHLPVPRVVSAVDGAELAEIDGHLVRALSWLAGAPMAAVRPHSPALLRELGGALAELDGALADEAAPPGGAGGPGRRWNLVHADEVVGHYAAAVAEPARAALLARVREAYAERTAPLERSLRRSLVHHDANDHNVLVDDAVGGQRLAGLIDFGDLAHGYTVAELAVACAYAMLGKRDPLAALRELVAGYHEALPLTDDELAALDGLVRMRLATSVSISAHEARRQPGVDYVTVSEVPAWALLEALDGLHPDLVHAHARHAAGLEPDPRSARVSAWVAERAGSFAPVVESSGDPVAVDWSVASADVGPGPDDLAASIDEARRRSGAELVVGRYGEARLAYATDGFAAAAEDRDEPRTVHLGVDLFLPAGSPVRAPLDGVVHSVRDNAAPLDYGPTVILAHAPAEGPPFLTLYGHLARVSIADLAPGRAIAAGEAFATLGDERENGGWPPHLHLQLAATDLGREGELPGVARPSERAIWQSLFPSSAVLAGLAPELADAEPPAPAALRARRAALLSPALSLSYQRPLHIVRGRLQHLFDAGGRAYLDAVNNVPHVGHSHPRVVRAAARQVRVLNTNTRYVHDELVRYGERLLALFPPHLDAVFFVNSGSEANELALRLARAATGGTDDVVVEGGYHGNTRALVERSHYKFARPAAKGGFAPPDDVHVVPLPDPYRGGFTPDDAGAAECYAAHVERVCAELTARGRRVSAMLAEPLIGCGGQVVPPPGWLARSFEHVRAAGGVCIADEVQVGFGRVGTHWWAFERDGAVPDVVTLGKPIANGHPMGAVVTTRAIADAFAGGLEWFNTFGGNPVSCAIANAVLDVIEEEGLRERATRVGTRLLAGLAELAERFELVACARGVGMYLGAQLTLDRATRAPAPEQAARIAERMRDRGVLLSTDGPHADVLKIKPPLAFGEEDAERLLTALGETLEETGLRRGSNRRDR